MLFRSNTGVDPISIKRTDAGVDSATVDLFATATAKVGARLNMPLYGIAGPYARAVAFATINADPLGNPCWALSTGLEAELGVRVTTPDLPVLGYYTLLDWHSPPFRPLDTTVASGPCLTSPEGASPPGGGPTAKALQSPAFAPWARVLGAAVDGGRVGDVSSYASTFPYLAPTIDGRYVEIGRAHV